MAGKLYYFIDTLIVIICLPFYLIVFPIAVFYQWRLKKRKVLLEMEVGHWFGPGVKEQFLVVDVSRSSEGFVGVKRRILIVGHGKKAIPDYSEEVAFIQIEKFWVPHPILERDHKQPA